MDVVQRPITYKAEQWVHGSDPSDIVGILKDTRVKFVAAPGRADLSWPPSSGFYENGPSERVWDTDWVVVSSTGAVRVLTSTEYEKEFYDDWEVPESPEQKIALLAKYMYRLANNDAFVVDPGDWSKLELMGRTAE